VNSSCCRPPISKTSRARALQPSDEDQIQFVVEQVNHILGRHYSLVEFDELPPIQMLQLLSDILGQLSPQAHVDFGQIPVEQGCQQLIVFITKTLTYRVPPMIQHSFFTDFIAGEKAIIIPVLYWILKRPEENRERIYLARYLSRLEIPEDLKMQDDGIRELCQRHEALRGDFIAVHKRAKALKQASADPDEARRRIQSLESERDQLQQSITTAQKKLNMVENRDALVSACKQLRSEQEDEGKLRSKRDEQTRAVAEAQRRARDATVRLRDVKRDIETNKLDAVVQRISDDLHANRLLLDQKLPGELNARMAKVAALTRIANEPLDLIAMQTELAQLDRDVMQLQAQVTKRNQPSDDGTNITVMKQQVQRVVSKKTEAMQKLQELQDKNNGLLELVRDKSNQLDKLRSSKILKGEDFKRFSNQVRSKTAAASNMKRRLADLRGEFGVLQYTEKHLKERHEELQGDLSELEERLGARGYVARAETLSKVGEEKAKVEQVKAQTLEELSAIVQNINREIHAHRDQLAPRIVELRNARNQAQTVEQEWEEKRGAYEYQQGVLMQEIHKLESEVGTLGDETRMNESVYHRFNTQLQLLKVQQKRVEDENEFRAGTRTLDATARTYAQMFHSKTEHLEQANKERQRRRRDIEENHETRLQQVEWFTALRKLLDAKIQSLNSVDPGKGPSLDQELQAVMNTTQGGVNRLVLGSD
jgi:intraflagellar transport protein 81